MFGIVIVVAVIAVLVWLFSRVDCDLQLLWAEKYGQPISEVRSKVVWVTGASSGIGEALAYILAANGAKLAISGTNRERLEEVKQKCIVCGQLDENDVLVLCFDIKNFSEHQKHFNSVISHFKRLDILVSNAGRSQRAVFEDIDINVDKEMFDINVFGLINLTRIVLRYFLQNQIKGQFLVTSSTAGKLGVTNSASYTASKHALHVRQCVETNHYKWHIQGYFECLRNESQSKGISVTMACPGPVFCRILEGAFTDQLDKKPMVESHKQDNRRMATSRCAHLMAIALVNKLDEAWICIQPILTFYYLSQYFPTLSHIIFPRFLTPERMAKFREGHK